jgi:hypothetical protein
MEMGQVVAKGSVFMVSYWFRCSRCTARRAEKKEPHNGVGPVQGTCCDLENQALIDTVSYERRV